MALCFPSDLDTIFFLLLFRVECLSWNNRRQPEIKDLFVLLLVDPLAHANLLQFKISHSSYWLSAQLVHLEIMHWSWQTQQKSEVLLIRGGEVRRWSDLGVVGPCL